MKIIHNSVLPFGKRYAAINLFGVLFLKRSASVNDVLLNHESIHTSQMKELLYLPFYVVYVVEWVVRLFQCKGNGYQAYMSISFEKEAYKHQRDFNYLSARTKYAQWERKK